MIYAYSDIEKIMNYKTWSVKRKIDTLLSIDADMYTNLGITSSRKEKNQVKNKSKNIYKTIQKLNPKDGKLLLHSMDI
jgi:hypothetical protein|tara:strand:- start:707 stop:940 length:234 start_codon:yes stop_codon:yes gene_type:complete